jgi:hypothetical protein
MGKKKQQKKDKAQDAGCGHAHGHAHGHTHGHAPDAEENERADIINRLEKFDLSGPLPDFKNFDMSLEILRNALAEFKLILNYSAKEEYDKVVKKPPIP